MFFEFGQLNKRLCASHLHEPNWRATSGEVLIQCAPCRYCGVTLVSPDYPYDITGVYWDFGQYLKRFVDPAMA